jgi:hypothetical protein
MKQHITVEQFDELSNEAKTKLFEALFHNIPNHPMNCFKAVYYGPVNINNEYITIGRMIEFLELHPIEEENDILMHIYQGSRSFVAWKAWHVDDDLKIEFCDALWEAVKEVLEK